MASATWDGHDHHMAAGPDDDFQHFLDMSTIGDGIQFDFNGFPDGAEAQAMMNRQRNPPDAIMNDAGASSMMPQGAGMMHGQPAQINPPGPPHTSAAAQMIPTTAPASDSISSIDAQIQYLQQQKFQQQQRQIQEQRNAFFASQNHSVPPTPQSIEMPPGSGNFYTQEQMSHEVYDGGYHQQQRMKERQDMAFTPLVSPAVTPLETHYMENNFTAYFSPLTSPALHAQNDSSSIYDPSTQSNNSPIEMDLEMSQAPAVVPMELSKKARENNAAKTRSRAGGIRNSPISKPLRRKTGPSPAIVSQVLSEVDERSQLNKMEPMLPLPVSSAEMSEENASVSPENLTEMPPPPVPTRRSMSKSPYIQAQSGTTPTSAPSSTTTVPASRSSVTNSPQAGADQPHPATPASLMRLAGSKAKKGSSHLNEQVHTDNIETLELPESVAKKQFPTINTEAAAKDAPYPDPGSANRSSFQPLPSPVFTRPGTASANQSPLIGPGSTGPAPRKTPQLAPRASRKRSTSSVHVSPALLPRISPNIKPLLPGTPGESAEDTASRLLMSKSNYQNILEGNTVPGVSYPSELSTNLTSKRTSHKIAEQGRRNRINSALQIMAGLLPDQKGCSGEDSDKKDSKQANAANSKASVVEKAIVHMQNLSKENVDLKEELQDLRTQLEKLKAKQ
ncbi:unnamed protein product [Clonostachys chloroleuca]|uniref:BHLH domain-containing protein n=1 Tax=Clonostachys chloroleuca TaxID=1926264 RepID=A0AA35LSQ9_9HYPO|nr:unnamed protein product [Clonostachys chloroleuca]